MKNLILSVEDITLKLKLFTVGDLTPNYVPELIREYPQKQVCYSQGKDALMKRKLHTPEQIVKKLRQADAVIASGGTVEQACKQLGISDATYYNWRKQYGQMKLDQVKRLKSLQKENAQLKKLVADISLDKAILEEALRGNY
jgi:putative transposase